MSTLSESIGYLKGAGGNEITSSTVSAKEALDISIAESVTINVADGSGSLTVDASNLDIRDLSSASDSVAAVQSGTWDIGTVGTVTTVSTITNVVHVDDNSGSLTVDASNLDIRDLSSASDSVAAVQSGTWDIGTLGTITNVVHVDDNGGSITIDGSVTATVASPNTNMQGAAVTVTDTEVALKGGGSVLANRLQIIVQNLGADPIYIGKTGVLTTTGIKLDKGSTITMELGPSNALYGIAASGKTVACRVLEIS